MFAPEEAEPLIILDDLHLAVRDKIDLSPDLVLLHDDLSAQCRHRMHGTAEVRHNLSAEVAEDRQACEHVAIERLADITTEGWRELVQNLLLVERLGALVRGLVVSEDLCTVLLGEGSRPHPRLE